MTTVLVVDDDLALARALGINLRAHGYEVTVVHDGRAALDRVAHLHPAVVILDLGLPDIDGIEVLQGIRGWSAIPVLVLSARSTSEEKVRALDAGADDYVTKPFEVDELVARLNAVLRRQGSMAGSRLGAGNLAFDTLSGDAFVADQPIPLSARERQLLGLLLRRQGQVVSKQLAEDQLYGLTEPVGSNAVEVHAHRLRKKLEASGADVRIETIRGVGYMLRGAAGSAA